MISFSFRVVRVSKIDSGLSYDLLLDKFEYNKKRKHPFLYIELNNKLITLTIESQPRMFRNYNFSSDEEESIIEVKNYVKENCTVLINNYFGKLSDRKTLELLRRK